MENTAENKAAFMAQYWGKPFINGVGGQSALSFTDLTYVANGTLAAVLLLKPLKSITDDDAIEVSKAILGKSYNDFVVQRYLPHIYYLDVFNGDHTVNVYWLGGVLKVFYDADRNPTSIDTREGYDILRRKGYAVPFLDLSVEEQIEFGWITLDQQ